jgi:spermidine synthase
MITLTNVSTAHGEIAILRHRATGGILYRQGEWYQSEADRRGVSLAPYVHAIYGLLLEARCRDVLIIGCGGGTLATMLQAAGMRVSIVDIAPQSFALARQYFQLPEEVACHVGDGRDLLLAKADHYDAIVLDAYQDGRIPQHFMTQAFLRLVGARLSANGAFFANVHVRHDLDLVADRLACLARRSWRYVRLLDARGTVNRNAIVMAGGVSALARPQIVTHPETGAEDIAQQLARLSFRPWHEPPNG